MPQDHAGAIRVGSEVTIAGAPVPGGASNATIAAEDNSADGANRMVRFRAVARGHGALLRPGSFVDVTAVVAPPRDAVLVPLTAVRRSPSGQHVFVLVEQAGKLRAQQRAIRTGPVHGDEIVVEAGLEANELIAASGSFKLRDGLLVQADAPPALEATRVN